MISEKQLKDYARKIYEKKPGYSLDKAFKLFARLAIKISLYLSQFSVEEMRDTIKSLNVSFLGMYKFELLQLEKEFIELEKLNNKFTDKDITNMTIGELINTGIVQEQYKVGQIGLDMIEKYTKLSKDYGIPIAKFQTIVNNAQLYTQLRDDAKEIINFYNNLRRLQNNGR